MLLFSAISSDYGQQHSDADFFSLKRNLLLLRQR